LREERFDNATPRVEIAKESIDEHLEIMKGLIDIKLLNEITHVSLD